MLACSYLHFHVCWNFIRKNHSVVTLFYICFPLYNHFSWKLLFQDGEVLNCDYFCLHLAFVCSGWQHCSYALLSNSSYVVGICAQFTFVKNVVFPWNMSIILVKCVLGHLCAWGGRQFNVVQNIAACTYTSISKHCRLLLWSNSWLVLLFWTLSIFPS
jgi:hypothetical protein